MLRKKTTDSRDVVVIRGGSGATVRISYSLTLKRMIAVKSHLRSGQPGEDAENREVLSPLFGKQHVVYIWGVNEKEAELIMEAVPGHTLHDAVTQNRVKGWKIEEILPQIYETFGKVWVETARSPSAAIPEKRNMIERAARIRAAIGDLRIGGIALGKYLDCPIRVNGRVIPPLRELLGRMSDRYEPPRRVVFCHGDPNPDNIMLTPRRGWKLVDLEWAGWHDPRLVNAQPIAWWTAYGRVYRESEHVGKVKVDTQYLNFAYHEVPTTPQVQRVLSQTWRFVASIGGRLGETSWLPQVNLQVATYLLGLQRFLKLRDQEHLRVALLGEALLKLADL